jgi:hypothetical protein
MKNNIGSSDATSQKTGARTRGYIFNIDKVNKIFEMTIRPLSANTIED